MSVHDRALIGSVFERKPPSIPSSPSSRFAGTPGTGFPAVQHRSKSAFARAREGAKGNVGTRTDEVPVVVSAKTVRSSEQSAGLPTASQRPLSDTKPIPTDTDALRRQINEENERKIASMSDVEIEREKREILEQLGAGTEELLQRIGEARRRKQEQEQRRAQEVAEAVGLEVRGQMSVEENVKIDKDNRQTRNEVHIVHPKPISPGLATRPSVLRVKSLENIGQSVPSPLPPTSSTRPSSRASRRLRFAEVTPEDVHVYESAPVSPKKTIFALPPPPDTKDDSIISLGTLNTDAIPSKRPHPTDSPTEEKRQTVPKDDVQLEEGSPEYIRRRYFPNVPANDPSLAWIESSVPDTADQSAPRFDLHGAPIPASLSASLPSHLGLHHHAEGRRAGYTIEDVFLLSRSTVPAQRATMLGVLARIVHRLGRQVRNPNASEKILEFFGKEGELRKRILAAGLAAMDQIGSLGARAVEVVWECLVEWDSTTSTLDGVELGLAPDVLSSLQLDYFLPQITDLLSHAALPSESLSQLLAIIHRLAQQSNQIAEMITTTPRLVPTILDTFLLKTISIEEDAAPPNPLALQVLITLASASRSNAAALVDPTDALLRFVALLPPSSPLPHALATSFLTHTLRLYTTLACYGLYSHIATTAAQYFTALGTYVLSTSSPPESTISPSSLNQLRIAWASLVEAWTVCATDPHATSPPHEILWSQVSAWGWAADLRRLRESASESDEALYAAIWNAEAAWLEGARINGVRGGEGEREEVLEVLRHTFSADGGSEYVVVHNAIEAIQRVLANAIPTIEEEAGRTLAGLAGHGTVLASALRLWLACLPPLTPGSPLTSPPFPLPFAELSALSASLAKHALWKLPSELGPHLRVHLRPLAAFLSCFHRVSRYIPGTTSQLWLAQAIVFMPRLLPGDEAYALRMLDAFASVNPPFVGLDIEGLGDSIDVLRPFLEYTIRPDPETYVSPLHPSPESVARASTLRLPSSSLSAVSDDNKPTQTPMRAPIPSGLPLPPDFLSNPLTHLLRSGSSPIFTGSISHPPSWSPSETDIVRATLLVVYAARGVLSGHGLGAFGPGPAEVVFACMRVCMLEHGVGVGAAGGTEEVFRDGVVEKLMRLLLEPYTARGHDRISPAALENASCRSLEVASAPYLAPTNTPFYQFYTDLVALYAAVSFAHPVFAALLIPPLAMRYPGDYRRALWCDGEVGGGATAGDSGPNQSPSPSMRTSTTATTVMPADASDVIRTLHVSLEDVICCWGPPGDVREYLYPLERDVGLLGAYVGALIGGGGTKGREVEGFLRLVAVHHVAGAIWGDLGGDGNGEGDGDGDGDGDGGLPKDTRTRLLRVILVRGDPRVVKEVVLHRQRAVGRGAFVSPPACYEGEVSEKEEDGAWREGRLEFVRKALGDVAGEKVRGLLLPMA